MNVKPILLSVLCGTFFAYVSGRSRSRFHSQRHPRSLDRSRWNMDDRKGSWECWEGFRLVS